MKIIRAYHLLAIAFVGLIAYSNVFGAPFVFDDLSPESGIASNPVIKHLDNFLVSSKAYKYNPRRFIGYMTFALNYRFGGLEVTGYHIVNLVIHIFNALLVYFLVVVTFRTPYFRRLGAEGRGLTKSGPVAWQHESRGAICDFQSPIPSPVPSSVAVAAALLFVAHPVQTQAVTYIVQRFTSLATFFYLLAVVMYVKGRLGLISSNSLSGLSWFMFSLLSAVLAMMTKEIAFTLPIMIVLFEFTCFRSTLKKKLFFLLPVLLTLIVIPASLLHLDRPPGEILSELGERTRVQTGMPRWDYFMTQQRVIVTYLRLIFFPVNQNLYYDYPTYHSLFELPVVLSSLLLSALFGTAVYLLYINRQADSDTPLTPPLPRGEVKGGGSDFSPFTFRPSRLVALGILWFFITLSVESSLIPIEDVIFEHRLYLPSVGIFISIAASLPLLAGRLKERPNMAKGVFPAFIAIIVILTAATWVRNTVWQDEVRLMEDVARKSPRSAKVRNGLGHAYMAKGQIEEAIGQFLSAIDLSPDYARAFNSLGVAYGKKGMYEEALEVFLSALALEPRNPEIYNNIGVVFRSLGDTDREITYYQAALEFDPDQPTTHYNLGTAYESKGLKEKAREHFSRAHGLAPEAY